jgi:hypothetical protein
MGDTLKRRDRTRIVWGEFVKLSSDDILVKHKSAGEPGEKTEKAEDFLTNLLEDGPVDKEHVERAATKRGISKMTLYRVSEELKIVKKTVGFGDKRRATWQLQE